MVGRNDKLEDVFLLMLGLGLTLLGQKVNKRKQEKAFHRNFEKEMRRLELEDKKGGQE